MGEKLTFKERMKKFFNINAPSTNGNKYEVHKQLEVQKELDLATTEKVNKLLRNDVADVEQMSLAIRRIGDELVAEKNLDPYFLLQAQANYFCNTCKFETDNLALKKMVINVIRGAFMMGCAGIYRNTKMNILEPVYITQMNYGIDGQLKYCKILPLATVITKMNETRNEVLADHLKGYREIKDEDCANIASFSWGTLGLSCWITLWPFIKLQDLMLRIITINGYVFNKKWIYKLNNYTNISKEIELFFNPSNPFIINVGSADDIANRFTTEEGTKTANTDDVIDYYNKMLGVHYHILGRKINNDYKKERNVSEEVKASQENYEIVQSEWLNQFEIFIEELKTWGLQIECIREEDIQEEQMQEEENNNESE